MISKLRVWWMPQVGVQSTFYVEVGSIEEGEKLCETLANYDLFQHQSNIKPDYANTGGIQYSSEDEWLDFDRDDFHEE